MKLHVHAELYDKHMILFFKKAIRYLECMYDRFSNDFLFYSII